MEKKLRLWIIRTKPENAIKKTSGDKSGLFLVGLENGKNTMKNDLYYQQRLNDKESFEVIFEDAIYLSYTFFYGFFETAIEEICKKHKKDTISKPSFKKVVINEFLDKYRIKLQDKKDISNAIRRFITIAVEERTDF